MEELHKNEQYFFDNRTLDNFITFLINSNFGLICFLCTPLLALKLLERTDDIDFDIFDIDRIFNNIKNFRYYNLNNNPYIEFDYHLIICDPPFFSVSLHNLLRSIESLTHYNYRTKIMISYLKRRENQFLDTFKDFNLKPTGFFPGYRSLENSGKNRIEFYSNIEEFEKKPFSNLLLLK